jgi:hypothetical protein
MNRGQDPKESFYYYFGDKMPNLLKFFGFFFFPLKMGPVGCPATSVNNYHYTLRNIPQQHMSTLTRNEDIGRRCVMAL